MGRLQIIQYTGAIATVIATVAQDPEVMEFLMAHPWTTGGLLSMPSFMTLVALAARSASRRRGSAAPEAVSEEDPSEAITDRIDVDEDGGY